MNWRSFFLALIFLPGLVLAAEAQPTIKIIVSPIPYFVDSEKSGGFIRLTEEIARRLNIKIELELYPNFRAVDIFKKGHGLALLPGSRPKLSNHSYYESETFFNKEVYIFSKTPQEYLSIKDLQNRRVGTTLGYTYPDLSKITGLDLQTAPTDESNLMKLHHNRLEVFLGEYYSVTEAIQRAGFKEIKASATPLTSEPIFYAFQKTSEGKIWLDRFNEAIRSLKKSGQLDKILYAK